MSKIEKYSVTNTFNDPSYGEFTTTLQYNSNGLFTATTLLSLPLSERDEYLFKSSLGEISLNKQRLTLVRIFDDEYENSLDLYFNRNEMEFVQSELAVWEKNLEKRQVTDTFNDRFYGEFTTTLRYNSGLFNATTKLLIPLSERDEYLFSRVGSMSVSEDRLTLVRFFESRPIGNLGLYFNRNEMEFVQSEISNWQ
jgi:hypothetical protein